jgi:predicted neuraminidase
LADAHQTQGQGSGEMTRSAATATVAWMLSAVAMHGALVIEQSGFIYERAPTPSCHASTIVETKSGLVAAWFGGTDEGKPDVTIWTARHDGKSWGAPVEVATGVQSDGSRWPCWNPVLFQAPQGPLLLFYKVGPKPSNWWGMVMRSEDSGKSWSKPERLPENILGPIRAKPVWLDGKLWCGSSSEHDGWRVHMEFTSDLGKTWTRTAALNDGKEFGAIQPTIIAWSPKRVQLLCRSRQGNVTECWTHDGGKTFTPMKATPLLNPSTGVDSVLLKDGRALFVYNNTPSGRTPLSIATSSDGTNWTHALTLEDAPGEYSYPAMIQTADGRVHVTYTWKRERIRHVVLKP